MNDINFIYIVLAIILLLHLQALYFLHKVDNSIKQLKESIILHSDVLLKHNYAIRVLNEKVDFRSENNKS